MLAIAAAILLSAFPYFEQTRNANELPRLVQAIARVEAGEWAIDGASRRGLSLGPDIARSPVDGRLYPNKPPGTSVVGTLAFRIARLGDPPTLREFTWWARLLAGVLPVLIILGVAWGRLRELGHGAPVVAALALTWLFGTPMFAYARLFYGHALAACLLYCGLVVLARGHERASAWRSGLGGLLAAAAIGVEYGVAFAGLPIAVALLLPVIGPARAPTRAARRQALLRAGVALAAALIPVLMLALYQRAVFGSMFATGYHNAVDPAFAQAHAQGLLGLGWPRVEKIGVDLLSPKTGLLVFSPIVVFALAGLVHAARRQGPRAWAARLDLAVFGCLLLVGLGLGFEGGWRIGPRYLVAALPCLLLGLAEAIEAWREGPVFAGLWTTAATWSLIACSLAATLWPHVDPTNIGTPFGEVFLALIGDGFGPYGLPQLISPGMGSVVAVALPVLLGVAVNVWAFGPRRIAVMLPMLVGVFMGMLIVLVMLPRSVVEPDKSERNLRYIETVYEPKIRFDEGGTVLEPGRTLVLD
ncbi:hypothetical protein ACNOYE_33905 [Nannocystaceae bacterium ST9]